jgi:hypothetical protein
MFASKSNSGNAVPASQEMSMRKPTFSSTKIFCSAKTRIQAGVVRLEGRKGNLGLPQKVYWKYWVVHIVGRNFIKNFEDLGLKHSTLYALCKSYVF